MDQHYKEEHEAFVSGSNGTTVNEILVLSLLTPLSNLGLSCLLEYCRQKLNAKRAPKFTYRLSEYIFIFLFSFPLISGTTFLNQHLKVLLLSVALITVFAVYVYSSYAFPFIANETEHRSRSRGLPTFVSHYRSQLMLETSVSILAVDFPVYPRRFVKTEQFGYGYMDVGVGCFIMAAGIVSNEARRLSAASRWENVKSTVKSSLILAIVGVIRAFSVWATNYQVHVTEYGVHWNFFLTIAAVRVLCSLLLSILSLNALTLLSGVSMLLYQWLLNKQGLTEFLFDDHRMGFFQENKEGVLSLIGYCFLYLLAVQIGKIIHKKEKVLSFLVFVASISYILMTLSHENIQPVSRRLLNISYILWMVFFNCFQLVVHFVCWEIIPADFESSLMLAINWNGMFHFMLSNVLTGIINFRVDTIHASTFHSLTTIISYVYYLSVVVIYLYRYRLKVNLLTFKIKNC